MMPPPRYDAVDSMEELGFDLKTNYGRFDLKGCADDKTLVALGEPVHAVHKRIFNVGMWCGMRCGLLKNATSRARRTRER